MLTFLLWRPQDQNVKPVFPFSSLFCYFLVSLVHFLLFFPAKSKLGAGINANFLTMEATRLKREAFIPL